MGGFVVCRTHSFAFLLPMRLFSPIRRCPFACLPMVQRVTETRVHAEHNSDGQEKADNENDQKTPNHCEGVAELGPREEEVVDSVEVAHELAPNGARGFVSASNVRRQIIEFDLHQRNVVICAVIAIMDVWSMDTRVPFSRIKAPSGPCNKIVIGVHAQTLNCSSQWFQNMALKLNLFYDILCPRSWVFYQVLQKKLPYWRTFREIEIEYFPISANFLHQKIYGNIHPAGIISRKKDYMLHELYDICDFYGVQKDNFEVTYELDVRRSRLCLLFLNYMRMNQPEYYQRFLEKIWSDFWHNSATFNHTAHFFRAGRELGIPFSEMDDIIMRIEDQTNKSDVSARLIQLLLEERVIGIPWFRIDSIPGHQKLFAFNEILRLEMLDELIAQPCYNPLNHNVDNPLYLPPDEPEDKNETESINAPIRRRKDRLAKLERRWKRRKFAMTN